MNIENHDLIKAIHDMTLNNVPYNRQKAYKSFLSGSYIIPTPPNPNITEAQLVYVTEEKKIDVIAGKDSSGKPILFVFTDLESLYAWKAEGCCYIALDAVHVLDFAIDSKFNMIVINPAGPTGMELTRNEMNMLREGTITRDYDKDLNMATVSIPEGTNAYIGAPTKEPSNELKNACCKEAAMHKEIESVYWYQVIYGKGDPHLVVGIHFSYRLEEEIVKNIISSIMTKVAPLIPSGEFIDFTELKNDNTLLSVKKLVKPTYERKIGFGLKLVKLFLKSIWEYAGNLSSPYLYIGSNMPQKITYPIDKWKLSTAIRLYGIHYFIDRNKNGALLFTGKCYQSLCNHKIALRYFKKLWETDPFNSICFKEIGTECLALERYEEGLQYAIKEVSQYPKNADSHANLSLLLLLSKKIDEAYNAIQRAKEIDNKSSFVNDIYQYVSDVKLGKKPIPKRLLPSGHLP